MKMNEHVIPTKNGWAIKVAGGKRASKIFDNKSEALDHAIGLAMKHDVCMVIHDEDSKFEKFVCKPQTGNQHVVLRDNTWAVINAGGKEVSQTFQNKGAAMAHAYDVATKNKVCMLVHDKDGKFKSVTCPPDGNPGIIELIRINMKH